MEEEEKKIIEIEEKKQEMKKDEQPQAVYQMKQVLSDIILEMKEIEEKYQSLLLKLNIEDSINKIENIDLNKKIEQINRRAKNTSKDILEKLIFSVQVQQELIANEYDIELKQEFHKIVEKRIQELIKNLKITKLEEEQKNVEKEKISLFDKMLGKGKLKQLRLENINLRKRIIENNVQEIKKEEYILEDSLSDLYVYIEELGNNVSAQIQDFIQNVNEILEEVDKEQLKQYKEKKTKLNKINWKLIAINGKELNTRQEISRINKDNEELIKKLQNSKIIILKKPNEENDNKLEEQQTLKKLQDIINQIIVELKLETNNKPDEDKIIS